MTSAGVACPACGRLLYDRRGPACGHCGADIPVALRLSPEERAIQAAEKARMEGERQADRARAEAEAQEAPPAWPAPGAGFDFLPHP